MSDGGAGALVQVVGELSKSKTGRVVLMVGSAYLALVGLGGSRDGRLYLYIAGTVALVCVIGIVRAWLRRKADQTITRSLLLALGVAVMVVVGGIAAVVLLVRRRKRGEPVTPVLPSEAELEALVQAEAREAA